MPAGLPRSCFVANHSISLGPNLDWATCPNASFSSHGRGHQIDRSYIEYSLQQSFIQVQADHVPAVLFRARDFSQISSRDGRIPAHHQPLCRPAHPGEKG